MVGFDRSDMLDPKGLIREAYRIEGITEAECRSIFLDWALGFDGDGKDGIAQLLHRYQDQPTDHPMSAVLRAGLDDAAAARRRGGRAARVAGAY